MPLTNHSGLIALLLEQLREGLLTTIKGFRIVRESIGMAMLTRKHTARDGPLSELATKLSWNFTPLSANQSMLGVLIKRLS